MATDLSKIPVEKRITLSDDPVHVGRTASILTHPRFLPAILARLAKENLFFAVTPHPGKTVEITCKIDQAHLLAQIVEQAEK
jgi:hypothetical protein